MVDSLRESIEEKREKQQQQKQQQCPPPHSTDEIALAQEPVQATKANDSSSSPNSRTQLPIEAGDYEKECAVEEGRKEVSELTATHSLALVKSSQPNSSKNLVKPSRLSTPNSCGNNIAVQAESVTKDASDTPTIEPVLPKSTHSSCLQKQQSHPLSTTRNPVTSQNTADIDKAVATADEDISAWLFFDSRLGLLGCSMCHQALSSPEHVRAHIRLSTTPHCGKMSVSNAQIELVKSAATTTTAAAVGTASDVFGLSDSPLQHPINIVSLYRNAPMSLLKLGHSTTLEAIPWLPVHSGYKCCLCQVYYHRMKSNMQEHLKKEHPAEWSSTTVYVLTQCDDDVLLQTLFLGNRTRYFPVHKRAGQVYMMSGAIPVSSPSPAATRASSKGRNRVGNESHRSGYDRDDAASGSHLLPVSNMRQQALVPATTAAPPLRPLSVTANVTDGPFRCSEFRPLLSALHFANGSRSDVLDVGAEIAREQRQKQDGEERQSQKQKQQQQQRSGQRRSTAHNVTTDNADTELRDMLARDRSLFLFLCPFDKVLRKLGYSSLAEVPIELVNTKKADKTFEQVCEDVTQYLVSAGNLAYETAPFLRELVQLTGFGGSNPHKFKPVRLDTVRKYATYLSSFVMFLIRTSDPSEERCRRPLPFSAFGSDDACGIGAGAGAVPVVTIEYGSADANNVADANDGECERPSIGGIVQPSSPKIERFFSEKKRQTLQKLICAYQWSARESLSGANTSTSSTNSSSSRSAVDECLASLFSALFLECLADSAPTTSLAICPLLALLSVKEEGLVWKDYGGGDDGKHYNRDDYDDDAEEELDYDDDDVDVDDDGNDETQWSSMGIGAESTRKARAKQHQNDTNQCPRRPSTPPNRSASLRRPLCRRRRRQRRRRFRKGSEMTHLLASILYCMSCTSLYLLRRRSHRSHRKHSTTGGGACDEEPHTASIRRVLSREKNTSYAYVRDILDKTCGERGLNDGTIRFTTCMDASHNRSGYVDDGCAIVDAVHLSLATVRQRLWIIEREMTELLHNSLLLTLPIDNDHFTQTVYQMRDKMTEDTLGVFFGSLPENISAFDSCARTLLAHICEGVVCAPNLTIDGRVAQAGTKLRSYFIVERKQSMKLRPSSFPSSSSSLPQASPERAGPQPRTPERAKASGGSDNNDEGGHEKELPNIPGVGRRVMGGVEHIGRNEGDNDNDNDDDDSHRASRNGVPSSVSIGGTHFNVHTINSWLQHCQRFLHLTLVYLYIAGGGPPRCTEMCSLRIRNGTRDRRNIYLDQGLVSFVTRYNKTQSWTEKRAGIARFLSSRASVMLVQYLMYVRPVENLFVCSLHSAAPPLCTLPSTAAAAVAVTVTEVNGSSSIADQLCRFHRTGHRCSSHMRRKRVNQADFLFVHDGELYAPSKVRAILERSLSEMTGKRFGANQWRHFQNHVEAEFMTYEMDTTATTITGGFVDRCKTHRRQHSANCPFAIVSHRAQQRVRDPSQAGHTTRTADLVYGKSHSYALTSTLYIRHRENSTRWHCMLGICCSMIRSVKKSHDDAVRAPPQIAANGAAAAVATSNDGRVGTCNTHVAAAEAGAAAAAAAAIPSCNNLGGVIGGVDDDGGDGGRGGSASVTTRHLSTQRTGIEEQQQRQPWVEKNTIIIGSTAADRRPLSRRRTPWRVLHSHIAAYPPDALHQPQPQPQKKEQQLSQRNLCDKDVLKVARAVVREMKAEIGNVIRHNEDAAAAPQVCKQKEGTGPKVTDANNEETSTIVVGEAGESISRRRSRAEDTCSDDEHRVKRSRSQHSHASVQRHPKSQFLLPPTRAEEREEGEDRKDDDIEIDDVKLYCRYIPYLREMTRNEKASFRSRSHWRMVHRALRRDRDILLVLPTGSGKTLLYLLVAFIEAQNAQQKGLPYPVSIVIVPTRALGQDVARRCSSMGLQAETWATRHKAQYSVLVLAVEHTIGHAYATLLDTLRQQGRLARIVSDECHLVVQWAGFRREMQQLRFRIHGDQYSGSGGGGDGDDDEGYEDDDNGDDPVLLPSMLTSSLSTTVTPVPLILSSATVPPSMEEAVLMAHAVDRRRLVVIRESTVRPNIAYSVLTTHALGKSKTSTGGPSRLAQRLQSVIAHEQDRITATTAASANDDNDDDGTTSQVLLRVLVYCPFVSMCASTVRALEQFAAKTNRPWSCALYHAKLNEQERDAVFRFWHANHERESVSSASVREMLTPTRIVVATSCFGTGVDVPDVRLVVHLGFSWDLTAFAQESGRAGRDGAPARSVVIYSKGFFRGYLKRLALPTPTAATTIDSNAAKSNDNSKSERGMTKGNSPSSSLPLQERESAPRETPPLPPPPLPPSLASSTTVAVAADAEVVSAAALAQNVQQTKIHQLEEFERWVLNDHACRRRALFALIDGQPPLACILEPPGTGSNSTTMAVTSAADTSSIVAQRNRASTSTPTFSARSSMCDVCASLRLSTHLALGKRNQAQALLGPVSSKKYQRRAMGDECNDLPRKNSRDKEMPSRKQSSEGAIESVFSVGGSNMNACNNDFIAATTTITDAAAAAASAIDETDSMLHEAIAIAAAVQDSDEVLGSTRGLCPPTVPSHAPKPPMPLAHPAKSSVLHQVAEAAAAATPPANITRRHPRRLRPEMIQAARQRVTEFKQTMAHLSEACPFCIVAKLEFHTGREACLPPGHCFNCFSPDHQVRDCRLRLDKILAATGAVTCAACGLNESCGTRLHRPDEWNRRDTCPYRTIIAILIAVWRHTELRERLIEQLPTAFVSREASGVHKNRSTTISDTEQQREHQHQPLLLPPPCSVAGAASCRVVVVDKEKEHDNRTGQQESVDDLRTFLQYFATTRLEDGLPNIVAVYKTVFEVIGLPRKYFG